MTLNQMSKKELFALAKRYGVSAPKRINKPDLIALISAGQQIHPMPAIVSLKLIREEGYDYQITDSPADVYALVRPFLEDKDREHLLMLLLNTKNQVIGIHTIAIGTLDSTIVSAREIFKTILVANASSIILAHNHPSGDSSPSAEDISVTASLARAGALFGIEILDHIIVGYKRYTSLKSENLI